MLRNLALATSLFALSCSGAVTPETIGEVKPKTVPVAAKLPPPQYVLGVAARRAGARNTPLPTGFGIVSGTSRIAFDSSGVPQGSAAGPTLNTIHNLGSKGFVFEGGSSLYHAPTFLGPLRLVYGDAQGFTRVSAGPKGLAVVSGDGRVTSVGLDGKTLGRIEPLGATVFATLENGTSVTVTATGAVLLSTDGGTKWNDVSSELRNRALDVKLDGPRLLVEDASGELYALEGGHFTATAPVAPKSSLETNENRSPYLDSAYRRGAPLDDTQSPTRALVADLGSVVEVDLVSGKVMKTLRGVLPPDMNCSAARNPMDILFLCSTSTRSLVARHSLEDGKTEIEHTWSAPGRFIRSGGAFMFEGPCEGTTSKPGVICLRTVDEAVVRYTEFDRSVDLQNGPGKEPSTIVTWIPTESSAVALLGGAVGGLMDARTGERTRLEPAEGSRLTELAPPRRQNETEWAFRVVALEEIDAPKGLARLLIEGWGRAGGVRIKNGGRIVDKSAFEFPNLKTNGPFALALRGKQLWQSSDYGQTFVEVAAPPSIANELPQDCSDSGCVLPSWFRRGWEPREPAVVDDAQAPAPSAPDFTPKLPLLRCELEGTPARKSAADELNLGFGAERLRAVPNKIPFRGTFSRGFNQALFGGLTSASLRAFVAGNIPDIDPDSGLPRVRGAEADRPISFLAPFEPTGTVLKATLKIGDLARLGETGGNLANILVESIDGFATPVLGDKAGVVLSDNNSVASILWVREGSVIALPLAPESIDAITSAIAIGPNELALGVNTSEARSRVLRVRPGASDAGIDLPLGQVPPLTSDVVAISPNSELAMIRIPTASPPDADNPAFLVTAGRAAVALAPWSTLTPANDPACAAHKGHRAIISTRRPWLSLGTETNAVEERLNVLRVSWSSERVCLEAAELDSTEHNLPIGTLRSYVVVDFGKETTAGQIGLISGAEVREKRRCTFEKK